jgi:hypothetical protein
MTRPGLAQAEAIAWPLVDPAFWGRPSVHRETLLPAFTRRLQTIGPDVDASRLAHHAWGHPDVLSHLQHHARRHLRPGAPAAELVEDRERPGEEILRWRWLSLALPACLLAVAASPSEQPPLWGVRLLTPGAAPTGPVAHHHLHAGAAFDFELLWVAIGADFDATEPQKAAPPGIEGQDWADRLLAALVLRRELAERWLHPTAPHRRPLDGEALRWLCSPGELSRTTRVRWRRALWRPPPLRRWERQEDVLRADPIGDGAARWHEADLLAEAFRRGERRALTHGESTAIARYLWVKTQLHRLLVMDPAARGLGSFVGYYGTIWKYRGHLGNVAFSLAARCDQLRLDAVELRTAPPTKVSQLLDLVAPARRGSPRRTCTTAEPAPEWGWILHFLRDQPVQPKRTTTRSTPQTSPRPPRTLLRRWRAHLAQALVLERALTRWPRLLHVLRGLDIAGEELEGPTWLTLPLLHRVRETSIRVARDAGVHPLRMTLHVGEDYASPVTGLRHVEELVRWGLLRRGDRVGHALVLGADLSRTPQPVLQPAAERFLDVAWLLLHHKARAVDLSAAHAHALCDELRVLGRDIVHCEHEPALLDLYRSLGDPTLMFRLGLQSMPAPSDLDPAGARVLRLMEAWDCHEQHEVDPARDLTAARDHQERLRKLSSGLQITVEMNPSSNLMVAGSDRLVDQPIFRLRPVDHRPAILPVTVSADDPLSFATGLEDEYAYAWAAMVHSDISASYAMRWVQEAAETSWRTRFTVPASRRLEGPVPQLGACRAWRDVRR